MDTDSLPGKAVLEALKRRVLATLNTQRKWREATDNLKVGDVVFVVDQNVPIGRW